LRVSNEAESEMTESADWYERHRRGLGGEFLESVDAAISRIRENPDIGFRVPGISDASIRQVFVRRFPYHVVYIRLPDRLQILALAHDRRKPAYWLRRRSSRQ
jgi:plasmid stabilization system protein ParE